MKILVAFYSKTKNTEKLAEALVEEFKEKGHTVEVEKIIPKKEHSFWAWWFIRIFKKDCPIQPVKVKDVSRFDFICFGSPNWSKLALPVAQYIKEVKGLRHKNVGLFATTFLPPLMGKYLVSAYLLEATFSWQISQRKGRVIDFLLLSSFFKKWEISSSRGKKLIKEFVKKLETSLISLKKHFLAQREVENTRFLVILFPIILFFFFLFQVISSALQQQVLSWQGFFIIFNIEAFIYFIILVILTNRTFVFLGRYLAGLSLIFGFTVVVMFLLPLLGRLIILSYILVLIIFIFFRQPRLFLFLGFMIFLSYFYLWLAYPIQGVLKPFLDIPFILLSLIFVSFIAKDLEDHFFDLLEAQEEVETANAILEIKVKARTNELKELSESLEDQVVERTLSLQKKIEDLERFNKLTVGRELKMIELKGEIKKLEKKVRDGKSYDRKKTKTKSK